jgi:hypothetical protein
MTIEMRSGFVHRRYLVDVTTLPCVQKVITFQVSVVGRFRLLVYQGFVLAS